MYVYDDDSNSQDPVLFYESEDDKDEAFTICAYYKHGFLFNHGDQKNKSEVKLVEVTHPSDESISIIFAKGQTPGLDKCTDFHQLAEPLGFTTEQEYLDLSSTAPVWMEKLFDDVEAVNEKSIKLNIDNDEAGGFKKVFDTSGISEFYVPGLDENIEIDQHIANSGNFKIDLGIEVTSRPMGIVPTSDKDKSNMCILRAKSGWKNVPYKRISEGGNDHIQIKMIKSELGFHNQFALCESMGARLPYLSDLTQVSLIHAFVDSHLDEYENFTVMKSNHLFTDDKDVIEFDIGKLLELPVSISKLDVIEKQKGNSYPSIMCVRNGRPYIDFSVGKESVEEFPPMKYTHTSFNSNRDFYWNELYSAKLNRYTMELDLVPEDASTQRPWFTVDRLRNYCETIDSYPKNCWEYSLKPDDSSMNECPYLAGPHKGILFPARLPPEEQICTHDEFIFSQENGKISRLRLEQRKLPLDKAKERCSSFGMNIYTPYRLEEAKKIINFFRMRTSWLDSKNYLDFWTNLEWTNDEQPTIMALNSELAEDTLERFINASSICYNNYFNHELTAVSSIANSRENCKPDPGLGHPNDNHFICVERIKGAYKQQRKVVIDYEHNTKEVIIDFVPAVHAIRYRANSESKNLTERAVPDENLHKIGFTYFGVSPWDGTKLATSYFESKTSISYRNRQQK